MPKSKLSLEDTLRVLANAGELTHLSIIPRAGKGPGGTIFSASYSPASVWGAGFGEDADPVVAMLKAIGDDRFKGLVAKLKLNTGALPMVIPAPLTAVELDRAAGKPAPVPKVGRNDEDEPWLKEV